MLQGIDVTIAEGDARTGEAVGGADREWIQVCRGRGRGRAKDAGGQNKSGGYQLFLSNSIVPATTVSITAAAASSRRRTKEAPMAIVTDTFLRF